MLRIATDPFEKRGFLVVDALLPREEIETLRAIVGSLPRSRKTRGGERNLLAKSPALRRYVDHGPLHDLAEELAGLGARATNLTLFDKTPSANWKIRWHQDSTIAVEERRPAAGFRGWSEKEGVVHVRAPAAVLESVVALRLHLDETRRSNGALRVLPGTHRLGILTRERIEECCKTHPEVVCEVPAGGVMAMRPLLLHASSKAAAPSRRR